MKTKSFKKVLFVDVCTLRDTLRTQYLTFLLLELLRTFSALQSWKTSYVLFMQLVSNDIQPQNEVETQL